MFNLKELLLEWGKKSFDDSFKLTVQKLTVKELPLQKGLTQSSIAIDDNLNVVVLDKNLENGFVKVKAGIFFSGVIAGCNCSDDPSPVDLQNEYCEVLFSIDDQTGNTKVDLL